jgi:integrase
MRHYSIRTEEAYVSWIKRFILFHGKRHPLEMGEDEITRFLSALAVHGQVSASTQNQALCALVFLYHHVLGQNLGWLDDVVRAKRPQRLPVVLTRPEVKALLGALEGVHWIMASLLYGAGLRLLECLRLRVKDIDFASHQMLLREGKGNKDRRTMLPAAVQEPLTGIWNTCANGTSMIWRTASAGSMCRTHCNGSIHTPTANGAGSGCSRAFRSAWTRGPGSTGDIICTNRCSNELSTRPRATSG